MEKRFGNYFLGNLHFSYMKECFRINFAIISVRRFPMEPFLETLWGPISAY